MKVSAMPRALMFVLLAVVAPLSGYSEESVVLGTVEGVVELDSAPVPDVRVVVSCSAKSDFEASAVTDDLGYFSISEIPLGDVSVQVFNSADELIAEGTATLDSADAPVTVELRSVS
jgi:phosphatidate phosphatase APP1